MAQTGAAPMFLMIGGVQRKGGGEGEKLGNRVFPNVFRAYHFA